jgi:predicted Fe-Mo cluster-binding NifX family protein
MKIAVVSTDGTTISQHFGRASTYLVFTVENGKVVSKETRPKAGHQHSESSADHHCGGHEGKHGCGPGSQEKHTGMIETIADCQILLAGGMGWGAYDSLKSYNIEPIITDVENIESAVNLYLAGNLPNLVQRLH